MRDEDRSQSSSLILSLIPHSTSLIPIRLLPPEAVLDVEQLGVAGLSGGHVCFTRSRRLLQVFTGKQVGVADQDVLVLAQVEVGEPVQALSDIGPGLAGLVLAFNRSALWRQAGALGTVQGILGAIQVKDVVLDVGENP